MPLNPKAEAEAIIELLEDLREYFDQRADVNWEGDGPNLEMTFLTRLDEIRNKLNDAR
jgi:hypothetical protein